MGVCGKKYKVLAGNRGYFTEIVKYLIRKSGIWRKYYVHYYG